MSSIKRWRGCRCLPGDDPIHGLPSKRPLRRPARWIEHVNKPKTEAEVKALQHSVNRGSPFGNDPWARQTARRPGLESTLRRRGPPKKDGA